MIYVALLRGINVGGNAKVAMSELKNTFESIGCSQVKTYINSGNVVFSDKRTIDELLPTIEDKITKDFKLSIRVVLRTQQQMHSLCADILATWTNDTEQKTDVLFLRDEIDSPDILKQISFKPNIETVRYMNGAIVWNIGRENVTKGSGVKLIKTSMYANMTVRNINTVRKLELLMRDINA